MTFGAARLLEVIEDLERAAGQAQAKANDVLLRADLPALGEARHDLRSAVLGFLNYLPELQRATAGVLGFSNLWHATQAGIRQRLDSHPGESGEELRRAFDLLAGKAQANAESLKQLGREAQSHRARLEETASLVAEAASGQPEADDETTRSLVDAGTALEISAARVVELLAELGVAWEESAGAFADAAQGVAPSKQEPEARRELTATVDRGLMAWERLRRTVSELQKEPPVALRGLAPDHSPKEDPND